MSTLSRFYRGVFYLVYLAAVVEVALQGFYYAMAGDFLFRRTGLPIFAHEPYAGYGNRPSLSFDHRTNEFHAHYYVNQAGFRVPRPDVEYVQAKPSDTYRIMLLGPSFAYGWGVNYELSFAGLLPRLLQKRGFAGDKKIELINAGVPAMPVGAQVTWFERVGRGYAPDLVIQFVYGSMAIPNISQSPLIIDDKGYIIPTETVSLRWRERLKNFATVFYGWSLWTKFHSSPAQPEERGGIVLGAGRKMFAPAPFAPTDQIVRESLQVYNELVGATSAAGARLLVVFIPLSYAIHKEDESRWRHLGMRDIAKGAAFDAAFVRDLNERQIPSIDITGPLRKSAESGERMYNWLDIHWTPAGNTVAAEAVADYLTGLARP
jgi:hypothetical protein